MNDCRLEVDQEIFASIVRHLRAALPNEGCGLLATVGNGGIRRAVRFFPGDNIDRSRTRFTMDPAQVAAALDEIERAGWRLGAIVHSHPATPPAPSATDLQEAYFPGVWLAIVSFAGARPVSRVWDVSAGCGVPPREIRLMIDSI